MARLTSWLRKYLAPSLHDAAWVPISVFLAYWLRFNLAPIPPENQQAMVGMAVVGLIVHAPLFSYLGLSRIVWRFVSLPDAIRIIKAAALGVPAVGLVLFILQMTSGVPRSVFLLYPVILLLGLTIPRVLLRIMIGRHTGIPTGARHRMLVVGTGGQAEQGLRNILQNTRYDPVGLVAESPDMGGREIHGVRVLGGISDIPELVRALEVETVVLAMEAKGHQFVSEIIRYCAEAGVQCRVISRGGQGGGEWDAGEWTLRPVTLEDLLFRNPVAFESSSVTDFLRGKAVLVTGGGGSIGYELCTQLAANDVGKLLVLDNNEYNLYQAEHDLKQSFPNASIAVCLGDVGDSRAMERLFDLHSPEVVFHAAAYKHVPLLELNPIPGVINNVFGTKTIAETADKKGCSHFVLISTDKAVHPTNLMGATKRIAEIFVQCFNERSRTRFITTRFGNVLGSTGSVIPLFEQQIAQGGPVTITHPEVTRFFMTIPEAVSLILAAGSIGEGGEVFVLDMGEPVKILDIAEKLIRLKELEPERDIPIVYIGLRPGEKLYEDLFHSWENVVGTAHPQLMVADSQHSRYSWDRVTEGISALEAATQGGDLAALINQMRILVPEYKAALPHPPEARRKAHLSVVE